MDLRTLRKTSKTSIGHISFTFKLRRFLPKLVSSTLFDAPDMPGPMSTGHPAILGTCGLIESWQEVAVPQKADVSRLG